MGPYRCIFQLSDGTFLMHIPAVRWNLSDAYSSCPIGHFRCIFQLSEGIFSMNIPAVRWDLSYAYSICPMGPFLGIFQLADEAFQHIFPNFPWDLSKALSNFNCDLYPSQSSMVHGQGNSPGNWNSHCIGSRAVNY